MTHSPDHAERAREVAAELTHSARLNLGGLSKHRTWLMVAEMKPKATGMGMTLLCCRQPALAERRWTSWGADRQHSLQRGEGYEYRLTPLGLAVRAALHDAKEAGEQGCGEGRGV